MQQSSSKPRGTRSRPKSGIEDIVGVYSSIWNDRWGQYVLTRLEKQRLYLDTFPELSESQVQSFNIYTLQHIALIINGLCPPAIRDIAHRALLKDSNKFSRIGPLKGYYNGRIASLSSALTHMPSHNATTFNLPSTIHCLPAVTLPHHFIIPYASQTRQPLTAAVTDATRPWYTLARTLGLRVKYPRCNHTHTAPTDTDSVSPLSVFTIGRMHARPTPYATPPLCNVLSSSRGVAEDPSVRGNPPMGAAGSDTGAGTGTHVDMGAGMDETMCPQWSWYLSDHTGTVPVLIMTHLTTHFDPTHPCPTNPHSTTPSALSISPDTHDNTQISTAPSKACGCIRSREGVVIYRCWACAPAPGSMCVLVHACLHLREDAPASATIPTIHAHAMRTNAATPTHATSSNVSKHSNTTSTTVTASMPDSDRMDDVTHETSIPSYMSSSNCPSHTPAASWLSVHPWDIIAIPEPSPLALAVPVLMSPSAISPIGDSCGATASGDTTSTTTADVTTTAIRANVAHATVPGAASTSTSTAPSLFFSSLEASLLHHVSGADPTPHSLTNPSSWLPTSSSSSSPSSSSAAFPTPLSSSTNTSTGTTTTSASTSINTSSVANNSHTACSTATPHPFSSTTSSSPPPSSKPWLPSSGLSSSLSQLPPSSLSSSHPLSVRINTLLTFLSAPLAAHAAVTAGLSPSSHSPSAPSRTPTNHSRKRNRSPVTSSAHIFPFADGTTTSAGSSGCDDANGISDDDVVVMSDTEDNKKNSYRASNIGRSTTGNHTDGRENNLTHSYANINVDSTPSSTHSVHAPIPPPLTSAALPPRPQAHSDWLVLLTATHSGNITFPEFPDFPDASHSNVFAVAGSPTTAPGISTFTSTSTLASSFTSPCNSSASPASALSASHHMPRTLLSALKHTHAALLSTVTATSTPADVIPGSRGDSTDVSAANVRVVGGDTVPPIDTSAISGHAGYTHSCSSNGSLGDGVTHTTGVTTTPAASAQPYSRGLAGGWSSDTGVCVMSIVTARNDITNTSNMRCNNVMSEGNALTGLEPGPHSAMELLVWWDGVNVCLRGGDVSGVLHVCCSCASSNVTVSTGMGTASGMGASEDDIVTRDEDSDADTHTDTHSDTRTSTHVATHTSNCCVTLLQTLRAHPHHLFRVTAKRLLLVLQTPSLLFAHAHWDVHHQNHQQQQQQRQDCHNTTQYQQTHGDMATASIATGPTIHANTNTSTGDSCGPADTDAAIAAYSGSSTGACAGGGASVNVDLAVNASPFTRVVTRARDIFKSLCVANFYLNISDIEYFSPAHPFPQTSPRLPGLIPSAEAVTRALHSILHPHLPARYYPVPPPRPYHGLHYHHRQQYWQQQQSTSLKLTLHRAVALARHASSLLPILLPSSQCAQTEGSLYHPALSQHLLPVAMYHTPTLAIPPYCSSSLPPNSAQSSASSILQPSPPASPSLLVACVTTSGPRLLLLDHAVLPRGCPLFQLLTPLPPSPSSASTPLPTSVHQDTRTPASQSSSLPMQSSAHIPSIPILYLPPNRATATVYVCGMPMTYCSVPSQLAILPLVSGDSPYSSTLLPHSPLSPHCAPPPLQRSPIPISTLSTLTSALQSLRLLLYQQRMRTVRGTVRAYTQHAAATVGGEIDRLGPSSSLLRSLLRGSDYCNDIGTNLGAGASMGRDTSRDVDNDINMNISQRSTASTLPSVSGYTTLPPPFAHYQYDTHIHNTHKAHSSPVKHNLPTTQPPLLPHQSQAHARTTYPHSTESSNRCFDTESVSVNDDSSNHIAISSDNSNPTSLRQSKKTHDMTLLEQSRALSARYDAALRRQGAYIATGTEMLQNDVNFTTTSCGNSANIATTSSARVCTVDLTSDDDEGQAPVPDDNRHDGASMVVHADEVSGSRGGMSGAVHVSSRCDAHTHPNAHTCATTHADIHRRARPYGNTRDELLLSLSTINAIEPTDAETWSLLRIMVGVSAEDEFLFPLSDINKPDDGVQEVLLVLPHTTAPTLSSPHSSPLSPLYTIHIGARISITDLQPILIAGRPALLGSVWSHVSTVGVDARCEALIPCMEETSGYNGAENNVWSAFSCATPSSSSSSALSSHSDASSASSYHTNSSAHYVNYTKTKKSSLTTPIPRTTSPAPLPWASCVDISHPCIFPLLASALTAIRYPQDVKKTALFFDLMQCSWPDMTSRYLLMIVLTAILTSRARENGIDISKMQPNLLSTTGDPTHTSIRNTHLPSLSCNGVKEYEHFGHLCEGSSTYRLLSQRLAAWASVYTQIPSRVPAPIPNAIPIPVRLPCMRLQSIAWVWFWLECPVCHLSTLMPSPYSATQLQCIGCAHPCLSSIAPVLARRTVQGMMDERDPTYSQRKLAMLSQDYPQLLTNPLFRSRMEQRCAKMDVLTRLQPSSDRLLMLSLPTALYRTIAVATTILGEDGGNIDQSAKDGDDGADGGHDIKENERCREERSYDYDSHNSYSDDECIGVGIDVDNNSSATSPPRVHPRPQCLPWRLRCAVWGTCGDGSAKLPFFSLDEASFSLLRLTDEHMTHTSQQILQHAGAPFIYARDVFLSRAVAFIGDVHAVALTATRAEVEMDELKASMERYIPNSLHSDAPSIFSDHIHVNRANTDGAIHNAAMTHTQGYAATGRGVSHADSALVHADTDIQSTNTTTTADTAHAPRDLTPMHAPSHRYTHTHPQAHKHTHLRAQAQAQARAWLGADNTASPVPLTVACTRTVRLGWHIRSIEDSFEGVLTGAVLPPSVAETLPIPTYALDNTASDRNSLSPHPHIFTAEALIRRLQLRRRRHISIPSASFAVPAPLLWHEVSVDALGGLPATVPATDTMAASKRKEPHDISRLPVISADFSRVGCLLVGDSGAYASKGMEPVLVADMRELQMALRHKSGEFMD